MSHTWMKYFTYMEVFHILERVISHIWMIYMCDVILMCDMTYSHVWHDSFICVTSHIHMCDMTHSYVWHDVFICVTWLIYLSDMTHSYVRHNSGGEQVALRYHSRHFVRTGAVCCMLQCVAQFCAVLHNVAQCCTLLQCFAYVAVCCSVLQFVADTIRATDCGRLQCVAVCYSLLWCVAQCYNVLQCVAVCCSVL